MGGTCGLDRDPERAAGEGHAFRPPTKRRRRRVARDPIDVHERPARLVGHPDAVRCDGDAVRRRPDGNGVGDGREPRIDARQRSVEAVRHPDGAVAEGDGTGPAAHGDSVRDLLGADVEAYESAADRVGHPDSTVADRDPLRGCIDVDRRPGLVGGGVDPRDAPVGGVGDPDRARPERDSGRCVPDRDRVHDRVGFGVDTRDGAVLRVGHPHGSRADHDPDRTGADLDRVEDVVALRVEPHDAAAAGWARHPDRAFPGCDPLRRIDPGGLVDDRPRTGVDHSDRVVLHARERDVGARAAPEREHRDRDRRRQHTRERADHDRPAIERPTETGGGFDELVLLSGVGGRRVAGAKRRKLCREPLDIELVDALGTVEVLEPELAEVAFVHAGQLVVGEHRRRRLRGQDLAAVARGHDPRRAMDAHPVIAGLRDQGLAGVEPHPHQQLAIFGPDVSLQRPLRIRGRGRGVAGPREDVEERVALRVHLLAAVARERLAHEPPVIVQHRRIPVAQLLDEPRRPLHVREQERDSRDGAGGEPGHGRERLRRSNSRLQKTEGPRANAPGRPRR